MESSRTNAKFDLQKWLDPRSHVKSMECAKAAVDSCVANYKSRYREWSGNVERNMSRIAGTGGRFIQDIYGTLPGGTVLVVGAGPSAEKNLNEIRKIKDRVLIICADRAYKMLRDAFIRPHLVVCADSSPNVAHFISGINKKTSVALSIISHSNTYSAARGSDIYWHGPVNPFDPFCSEWIEKYGEKIASCRQGFTVTNIAIDIAVWLGSAAVIVTGNDNGWTSRKKFKKDANAKSSMIRVNENFVTIPQFKDAATYSAFFPDWHPDILFVDASEGLHTYNWTVKSMKEITKEMEARHDVGGDNTARKTPAAAVGL